MSATAIADPGVYIDGTWRAASGPTRSVVNPATEETLATLADATSNDVNEAVAAACTAADAWANQPGGVRGSAVRAIGDVIRANVDELARLLATEVGKPVAAAHGELAFAANYADYMSGWDRRIEGDVVQSDNVDETILLQRVPMGVVAAITAWNFPLALFVRKVAPALVTGNTVVVKASEVTPLSTAALVRMLAESLDLPAGVLNLVGGGREIGQALVKHEDVDMVTFTGHRDSGKAVMVDAAQNLTRVSLELGGKAPAIVWSDADLDKAVEAISIARHTNSGQVCTCAERVIVHEDVYEEFVDRYRDKVTSLRVGDPQTDVDMGPLVNAAQYEKSSTAIARAVDQGARVLVGGDRPAGEGFERGYWLKPTILVDVERGMDVMREEVFGPVTPIARAGTYDEAFSIANETRYGLSAFVFTNDYRTAMRAARDLKCGELYINRTHGEQAQAHHSGHKESGSGGEDGRHGVLRYTQLRSVYHNFG